LGSVGYHKFNSSKFGSPSEETRQLFSLGTEIKNPGYKKLNTVAAATGYRWKTVGTSNPRLGSERCMGSDKNTSDGKIMIYLTFSENSESF
jgi:hypothetical protein